MPDPAPPPTVVLHYERHLDAPLKAAFEWLTDYQDHDPTLTTAIVMKRPVLERTKDRVVLDGEIMVAGRAMKGRAIVSLFPPDRWEANFEGRGFGTSYKYRLVPEAKGCRLVVDYHIKRPRKLLRRIALQLGKGKILREIDTMWDGFVSHMDRDLAAARHSR